MRARVVRVNGSTDEIDLPEDTSAWLTAAYKAIGCNTVEKVTVVPAGPGRHGIDMWADEEGLYSKGANIIAAGMLYVLTGRELTQHIAGDVIFTGGADSEGDCLGLTPVQDAILADMATEMAAQARRLHILIPA